MSIYNHKKIEQKWQIEWERSGLYKAEDFSKKPKYYILVEFPYPSGDGLHAGHVRSYTAMDIVARKRRMEGYNVLYPIGWDAFGLPTENYAIKTGIHPQIVTKKNTDRFREQLKLLGFSFDWSREINTSNPSYYKWTQWIFLQLFNKGLAYKQKININWCLSCKIGLANEEVVDGKCERCGGDVEKREKEQWMLAITKYADRLYEGLDKVDYSKKIKIQQRNWIGPSVGSDILFGIENSSIKIKIFTTRADTSFGVTFLVLSPEGELTQELLKLSKNKKELKKYIENALKLTDMERMAKDKEKTGLELKGIKAINPVSGKRIPVWLADYVVSDYGTGATMAVPAHDNRDYEFAKKYGLPIKKVIVPINDTITIKHKVCFTEDGRLINSDKFDGLASEDARKKITQFVKGKVIKRFKLRDWVFSRQRYWGEPIPIVQCKKCGWVPVPEQKLPVRLPKIDSYQPNDNGESPLATITEWVNTKCPKCNGPAERETDTMPNWAGSSWYFLRYIDPYNNHGIADKNKLKYWEQVDWYNGGMEHVTLHLLYSRFWNQFLYDIGVVQFEEPYKKRTAHGMILGSGGIKMSKSKGNVVNPDDIIDQYGADTLRIYEMFLGPFDQSVAWSTDSIKGSRRFLEKVWKLQDKVKNTEIDEDYEIFINKIIKKVTNDIEKMAFNTAVAQLMIAVNKMEKMPILPKALFKQFLLILAPFAPHISEELWHKIGNKSYIHSEKWLTYNDNCLTDKNIIIIIQVNGKVRDQFQVKTKTNKIALIELAKNREKIKKFIDEKTILQTIYIQDKLINFVI